MHGKYTHWGIGTEKNSSAVSFKEKQLQSELLGQFRLIGDRAVDGVV